MKIDGAEVSGPDTLVREPDDRASAGVCRIVTLGDSMTVGIGDPLPCGGFRGWAALLAGVTDRSELHNLAANGARAADLVTGQLPRAVELHPDVASVIVGVNDTLRGRFDVTEFAHDVTTVLSSLHRRSTVILTASLPDPGRMLGVPELVARPLARRVRSINAVIAELSARFATIHLDLAHRSDTYDRCMWGVDRLHPSERGHRMVARLYARHLMERGWPIAHLPGAEPEHPPASTLEQLHWLATKGTTWMARRSVDLLPTLTRLAVREWWFDVANRTPELDEAASDSLQSTRTAGIGDRRRAHSARVNRGACERPRPTSPREQRLPPLPGS